MASKMTMRILKHGDRIIYIGSLNDKINYEINGQFGVLLPAYNKKERQKCEQICIDLVEIECMEFCCIGSEAEILHDSLDYIIEDINALDIVTTYDFDENEACEYFLFGMGAGTYSLLALVEEHESIVNLLITLINEDSLG